MTIKDIVYSPDAKGAWIIYKEGPSTCVSIDELQKLRDMIYSALDAAAQKDGYGQGAYG